MHGTSTNEKYIRSATRVEEKRVPTRANSFYRYARVEQPNGDVGIAPRDYVGIINALEKDERMKNGMMHVSISFHSPSC